LSFHRSLFSGSPSLPPSSRMNWPATRYIALLCFPARVRHGEADGAGTVPSGPCVLFGEEEDPVGDVAASSDGAQRGRAVETAIHAVAAVTAQSPWHSAGVGLAIRADKFPALAHASPFVWRRVDIVRAGFIGGNNSLWQHSGKAEAALSVSGAALLACSLERACFCQHVRRSARRYDLPAGTQYNPQKQTGAI
jgi:hypothetical protein